MKTESAELVLDGQFLHIQDRTGPRSQHISGEFPIEMVKAGFPKLCPTFQLSITDERVSRFGSRKDSNGDYCYFLHLISFDVPNGSQELRTLEEICFFIARQINKETFRSRLEVLESRLSCDGYFDLHRLRIHADGMVTPSSWCLENRLPPFKPFSLETARFVFDKYNCLDVEPCGWKHVFSRAIQFGDDQLDVLSHVVEQLVGRNLLDELDSEFQRIALRSELKRYSDLDLDPVTLGLWYGFAPQDNAEI